MNSPATAPVNATNPAAVAQAAALEVIAAAEPGVAAAIAGELASQRRQLKLIASENYVSPAVLLAMGNWLSDKYAEGTIGRRNDAGGEMVDRVESIAAGHARALFGAEHAARAAGSRRAPPGHAPFVDKGCPMVLGGPLPHVMAAKAIAFAEARQPSSPPMPRGSPQRPGAGRGPAAPRRHAWLPAAPATTSC